MRGVRRNSGKKDKHGNKDVRPHAPFYGCLTTSYLKSSEHYLALIGMTLMHDFPPMNGCRFPLMSEMGVCLGSPRRYESIPGSMKANLRIGRRLTGQAADNKTETTPKATAYEFIYTPSRLNVENTSNIHSCVFIFRASFRAITAESNHL